MNSPAIIDTRLKLLSNSSQVLLHKCPRKYQLQKLWATYEKEDNVHFSYGSMFGEGFQQILAGTPIEDAVLIALTKWTMDLYDTEKEKTVWHCIQALINFEKILPESELADYEVVIFNGKPACELSFSIAFQDGFYYRGYIDILLQHKLTGTALVVDAKTSGALYSKPDKFQNSGQAIGYSVVIDAILPGTSSFEVMYYELLTKTNKYVAHVFVKDYMERANWIRDIMLDIGIMQLYNKFPEWPMHGESCSGYGNYSCQFLDNCTMKTEYLVDTNNLVTMDGLEYDASLNHTYDFNITVQELINAQINR